MCSNRYNCPEQPGSLHHQMWSFLARALFMLLQVLALEILLSRNTARVSRVKIKCLVNSATLFLHLRCCIYTRRFLLWLCGSSNFPQTYSSFLHCWLHFFLSFADSAPSDTMMAWAAKLTVLSVHVPLDQHFLGPFLYLTLYSKGCPEFWTLLGSAGKECGSPHLRLLCVDVVLAVCLRDTAQPCLWWQNAGVWVCRAWQGNSVLLHTKQFFTLLIK